MQAQGEENCLATADKNGKLAQMSDYLNNDHWEWGTTIRFYQVLHLMTIYLTRLFNENPKHIAFEKFKENGNRWDHKSRKWALTGLANSSVLPREIKKAYVNLMNFSQKARYDCLEKPFQLEDVTQAYNQLYDYLVQKLNLKSDEQPTYINRSFN